ncbi:M64 family metallopeptidase [Litoribaculum gwangyangense]|uniref:Secretion system C-terminal sorting domain-containing protein n=1 Tax=Litoribaculum gwangyangense TaxID=1130722 RepID=A0ABP9C6D9_9FLAO
MKQRFLFILFLINVMKVSAQIFDVQALKVSGDNDKRINLVILSEGYQISEFAKFETDATNFMNDMFSQSPFLEYADYFNVFIIKVPSNESGADHPGTATDVSEPASPITTADTYFNATFDSFGFHRLLFYEIDGFYANNTESKINAVLANNFPEYDQTIILVNSNVYGGSGGPFPMASTGSSSSEIAIHELGHSLFDLKDEYYPGDALAAEAINMTQETNASLVKWKNWIDINSIGVYPYGTSGTAATWNRPHQNCKMRYLGVPFCSVCKEGIIEKIHDLVSPIDSYNPVSNSVNNPSFPLDFGINLIKTIPNTLLNEWTLNGLNIATNVDAVSIMETDLVEGFNSLSTVVTDNSSALKVDNHETIHVYTVTWTINYSTLGLEDITSAINNLSINMYPNPTNSIINFKFENLRNLNLKIDIVSLDGKKIESLFVSNYETQQLDLGNLSKGIYITNFYVDNVLVTSKKIVKN